MAKVVFEKHAALCPRCRRPHAFTSVKFKGGFNDRGTWSVTCSGCAQQFLIAVTNPRESNAQFPVAQRFVEDQALPPLPSAKDKIIHNMPDGDYAAVFDYGGAALYQCPATGKSLEEPAREELSRAYQLVTAAYVTAQNNCANGRCGDVVVVRIEVPCLCASSHTASFYTPLLIGVRPPQVEAYLLANVSGTELEDRIEGLYSKSDIMDFLSKLLVRWHLTCDRIIVASPFVGHQFDDEERKKDRWDWLLKQLDPERATLITRPATFAAFKKLSHGDVTYDLLERYGLENKIISANTKKQDFHAKFFIGMDAQRAEVLSGSANLVHGPSIENAVFRRMDTQRCEKRYIDVMNVSMPAVASRTPQYVRIRKSERGDWVSERAAGDRLAG